MAYKALNDLDSLNTDNFISHSFITFWQFYTMSPSQLDYYSQNCSLIVTFPDLFISIVPNFV